jgi:hypothetical protein
VTDADFAAAHDEAYGSFAADFAAAHDEAYGSFADAHREVYGSRPRRRSATRPVPKPTREAPVPYRVTAHARIRCDCGVYVYTESHGGGRPMLPPSCWRCLSPLTQ